MDNPFEHKQAVSGKIFTGRSEEIEFIQKGFHQTLADRPNHLMVYGARGLGKTSLLNHVQEELKGQKILLVPCFLGECQDMAEATMLFLDTFYAALTQQREFSLPRALFEGVKRILAKVSGVKVGPDGISIDFNKDDAKRLPGQLSTIIADLWKEISREFSAFCIVFDELDRLAPEDEDRPSFVGTRFLSKIFRARRPTEDAAKKEFLKSFAYSLRSIIQTLNSRKIARVKFIMCCLPALKEKLDVTHPTLGCAFEHVELKEFDDATVLELLRRGLALDGNRKSATAGFGRLLCQYSDGIPYHVQLICYHAYDADSDGVLDEEDFHRALFCDRGVIDSLRHRYYDTAFKQACSVWSKARDCLILMAEADGEITLATLREKLPEKKNSIPTGVSKLRYHGFVAESEQKGKYQLSNHLCRAWVYKFLMKKELPLGG